MKDCCRLNEHRATISTYKPPDDPRTAENHSWAQPLYTQKPRMSIGHFEYIFK